MVDSGRSEIHKSALSGGALRLFIYEYGGSSRIAARTASPPQLGVRKASRVKTVFAFPETTVANLPAQMGVIWMTDRYGNTLNITRDAATGNLLQVTSANGRW